ncbi:MAG: T9SS type A sorting domain-containing protein, partial [Saprospiraceae bacterium]|nr:T9SS type A sorting domain-containing protein [Saprospiraceae bacterium]
YQTDAKGIYAFTNLDMKKDYSIIPKRDDDPTNGISTIDLVLLQKHIQGIEPLNSAYKVIAADVDRSNDISVVDLIELRKLILTIYDKLPNNTSWRFVPKSFSFSNISSPWGFQEKLDINSLSKDELNRDFVGVKVGDVNATAVAHSLLGAEARSGAQTLKFNTADRTLSAEEEAVLEFTSENFKGIAGYQFSLAMKGLDLKSVQSGLLKVNESNFGVTKLGQGYVTTSWNESRGITAGANDVLFSIKVKATKATILSEALLINSKYTRAEAYNNSETLNVALEVGNKKSAAGYALHQNTPNPFKATTVIGYELAKAGTVTMRITDVTGKLVRMYNQYGVKGYNQFKVNRSEISGAGVFYYTVETESTGKGGKDFSAAKKMILVD